MTERSDTDPGNGASPADAAARWRVALESEAASEADWLAFEQWLSADPMHQAAYAAMENAAIDAELALSQRRAASIEPAQRANIVPFARRWLSRPALWTAGVAAIAACGVFLLTRTPTTPPLEYAFAAPATSDERVTLPDGSSVHLNRNAAIQVSFADTRRIVLERGEASFTVAHDETHPFEVAVGDALVRDIGTIFNVARNDASSVITVRDGEVEISAPGVETIRIAAGYQARLAQGAPILVSSAAGDAFAWQQGRLVYDDAPLAVVIEDLNRYSTTPIVLGETAQDQRFSGVLILDSPQIMLARLESFLPIRSAETGGQIVVESRP